MAFIGKVYKFVKEENFDELLKNIGVPDEHIQNLLKFKPSLQLLKEGDKYKHVYISEEGTKEQVFELGVESEDVLKDKIPFKSVTTIDGNTVTQVVTFGKGPTTFKREYNGDDLKMTVTSPMWNGVAYRYYKA